MRSLTVFPFGKDSQFPPDWRSFNDSESCNWLVENAVKSKMIWKTHRSKKYRYIQARIFKGMAHNYQHLGQRLIIFSIHEVNFIKSTKGRLWNRNKTGCFSTDHIDGAGYRKSSWSNGELTLLSGRRNFEIETLSYYTYKSRWKNCFSLWPLAKQALFSCWLYVSCQTGNFRLQSMFRL